MNKKGKRLIRKPEVLHMTGIESRSTLYYMVKKGSFPAPVKLSERIIAWHEQDIIDWINSRETVSIGVSNDL